MDEIILLVWIELLLFIFLEIIEPLTVKPILLFKIYKLLDIILLDMVLLVYKSPYNLILESIN